MTQTIGFGNYIELEKVFLSDEECINAIRTLSPEDQMHFADYFSQLNALLSVTNQPMAAALGCSLNTQPLVTTESAMHAMFYIVSYIDKDTLSPAQLLDFIEAAKKKCDTFKGSAPAGETAESNNHPLRRLTQVIHNGPVANAEWGIQQCALNNGSMDPHLASPPNFAFVFSKPLVSALRAADNGRPHDDDAIHQQVGLGLAPIIRRPDRKRNSIPSSIQATVTTTTTDNNNRSELSTGVSNCSIPQSSMQNSSTTDSTTNVVNSTLTANPFDAEELSDDSFEDEINIEENPKPSTGTANRTSTGKIVLTSQDVRIRHRGTRLCRFSGTEYACCVRDVELAPVRPPKAAPKQSDAELLESDNDALRRRDIDNEVDEGNESNDAVELTDADTGSNSKNGRKPSATFAYNTSYELSGNHTQRLASNISCPIFGGINAYPRWPSLLNDCIGDELLSQRAHFAEWVLAMFLPLCAPGYNYPGHDVLDRFERILPQLYKGSFLLVKATDGKCGRGDYYDLPPGYTDDNEKIYELNADTTVNPDFKAYEFTQQCIARFIGKCANGIRRNPNDRRIQKMWHSRAAQHWHGAAPDPELALFPTSHSTSHAAKQREGFAYNPDVNCPQTDNELFGMMITLLEDAHERRKSINGDGIISPFIENMQYSLSLLHVAENPQNIWDLDDNPPIPTVEDGQLISLEKVDQVASALLRKDDEETVVPSPILLQPTHTVTTRTPAMNALRDLRLRSGKVPNDGQFNVLQIFAEYFDALHQGTDSEPPLVFLAGEGGTGKSFLFECLEEIAFAVLFFIVATALTGIACTSIHTRCSVRTTAALFHLGIKPCNIHELESDKLQLFRSRLGNPIAIIIDEISFADVGVVEAVSR
jgi:hypothetical protein